MIAPGPPASGKAPRIGASVLLGWNEKRDVCEQKAILQLGGGKHCAPLVFAVDKKTGLTISHLISRETSENNSLVFHEMG